MFPQSPPDEYKTPYPGPSTASLRTPLVTVTASPRPESPDPDQELLREAHENFRLCVTAEADWRRSAMEELEFVDSLKHWTNDMLTERTGRPCLTFDRIGPSVDMVVNDMRQNPPEAKVLPVGSGSDKVTAEILQGLIRNIDQDSSAEIAYMTAYEHAVKIGRGWWRVHFAWEADDSFEQKLVVMRVGNPFSVYPDPNAENWDYSDMQYCFVTEEMTRAAFKQMYPDARVTTGIDLEGTGDLRQQWFPNDNIRIAEYWKVTTEPKRLLMLADGSRVSEDQLPEGAQVAGERKIYRRIVSGSKLTGAEVLERWEWKGKWIPMIPVIGREVLKNGRRRLRGMVRPAMDANLSYDFMRSKQVEAVGLAPLAPWLVEEGQIAPFEATWVDANRKAYPFLKYRARDIAGAAIPPPSRNTAEPAIAAITTAVQMADNDVKAMLSTYDASLGNAGPESSGRAILARQREGDNAHFHFHHNLARSMKQSARVELDLAKYVYSEERLVSIADPDGQIRQVEINKDTLYQGVQRIFRVGEDFNPARYDVTIGTGPSYASRRAQAQEMLVQLMPVMPALQQRAADLIVKNLDLPNADEIADRVRPRDIQDQKEGQPPIPPQAQAQMMQQQQMIQAMTQQLNKLSELLETRKLDLASRERIAEIQAATQLAVADLKAGVDHSLGLMREEFASIKDTLDRLAPPEDAGSAKKPAVPAPAPIPPGTAGAGGAMVPVAPIAPAPRAA